MANARILLNVRITEHQEGERTMEITRPDKDAWQVALPAGLDNDERLTELVNYVTTQYLVEMPGESIRLGWETIYALVRTALAEAA